MAEGHQRHLFPGDAPPPPFAPLRDAVYTSDGLKRGRAASGAQTVVRSRPHTAWPSSGARRRHHAVQLSSRIPAVPAGRAAPARPGRSHRPGGDADVPRGKDVVGGFERKRGTRSEATRGTGKKKKKKRNV